MRNSSFADFYALPSAPVAVVLGTNEIASAVAVHLSLAGYPVVLSHDPYPPVIRRAMSFDDALFGDRPVVETVTGERVETAWEPASVLAKPRHAAVTSLHLTDLIALRCPDIMIDARMQKHRMTPDYRRIVGLTVGLGSNFAVGLNCDVAIETRPAKNGSIVRYGRTDAADGVARTLGGFGRKRFIYASRAGRWHTALEIGAVTAKGAVLGHLDGCPIEAPIDGVLRGLARDSSLVPAGVKLLEIDARGASAAWTGIDERGRAIAEATLHAIEEHASGPGGRRRAVDPCLS